ncbi:PepSY domain-containing protein [Streptomyces sp. NPDC048636]|uniref:PepSY domain-containing protein n=1 Tax=Streptomyces sp. NPDC048636 TaxID=3155762 RepID=UPI0034185747
MKRNIVIATVAAAALIGGGSAVALADGGTGGAQSSSAGAAQNSAKMAAFQADDRDDADDANDTDDADGRDDAKDRDDADDNGGRDAESAGKARVTLSDAAATALKAAPGTLSSIDLDDDARTTAWDAEILGKDGKWHEVGVDATSGKVLNQRVDREEAADSDDAAERAALKKADVSAVEAARKAAAGGSTVTSVGIDDDRAAAWEVEVVKNHKERELTVDAQTGKVAQTASDDDKADDRDDD